MAIFNAMNKVYDDTNQVEMARLTSNATKNLSAILGIAQEMILADNKLFEALFVMNFEEKKRLKLISEHIGINHTSLVVSKDKEEIVRFSANIMTFEALTKIWPNVSAVCGIRLEEFITAWLILTNIGALVKIMFLKKHDPKDLSPEAAELYKRKDEKFSVEKILDAMEDDEFDEDEGEEI